MDSRRQAGYVRLGSNDAIVSRLAQQDSVSWYIKPNLRFLYLLMLPTCFCAMINLGFDMSLMSGLQAVPSWLEYFHHPRSASLGFVVAIYSLGALVAAPSVPLVVDNMGRRYPMFLAGMITIVGAVLQGFALNYTMFAISRFILGFSSIFGIVAASSLIGELSHPNERAFMCSIFNSSFYDVGAVAMAALTLVTFSTSNDCQWKWRFPSFLQAVPSIFQVIFIWLLPESPRWLISRGRGNEAYSILVKYHAEGDENSAFVRAEYEQIEQTLEMELKISELSWKDAFSTPVMRRRIIIAIFLGVGFQWCGVGLASYFLPEILDTIGIHDNRVKNIIGLARISWSFVNGTFFGLVVPRYPRRTTFLTCAVSLFVVLIAWTVATAAYSLTHSQVAAQIVLVLIFLYNAAHNLGFGALIYTFLIELFPFHLRVRGLSTSLWCLRIAVVISQFMDPIGIEAIGWKWFIGYCMWNAFQVVFVYLMLPETSGRTLEELSFLYGDEQDQEISGLTEVDTLPGNRESESQYSTME